MTGAENPRLSEGTGGSAISANTKVSADLVKVSDAALDAAPARELERQVAAVAADEPDRERDHHRLLARLAGRRRDGLREVQPVGLGARIVAAGDDDLGRAGLRIPEHELAEVDAR